MSARAAEGRRAASGPGAARTSVHVAQPAAASLSATKTDSFADPDGDTKAEPGQTITYTVTITNNGPDDATGVVFNDTVDPNTTLVPGSVQTQPIAANDSYNVLGNVRIQPNAAAGLLANDCDPDNGGPCSSAGLTATGPATSAQGGNVSVNPDGSFSYNPPAGFEGIDTFTYTVSDGTYTDTATATFTVNDVVWFVDNTAPAGGDGRLTSPFNSLAPLNGAGDPDEPSDVIFVYEGTGAYGGGIVLENLQRLVGQGVSLDAALAAFAIAVPPHSDPRPAAASNPTLANAGGDVVTLASGNTVLALNASASAAASAAISGNGVGGATVVENVGASASGAAGGVSLVNLAGTFNMTNSTVSASSSGTAVLVSGGAAAVNFNNTDVNQTGGRVVDIQNRTGGTVLFDAASSVTGTNGTTDAVSLLSNTGTISFLGPVQLNTNAAGVRGLVADSGTLNMTSGTNAVSSTGGAAVDIENLTANVSFATTFSTSSTGRGLRVDGVSGTASFGNAAVNDSANTGVLLTDNAAAITFADLDIAPAAGVRALHATGNTGAITSSSGVVSTTGATAVQIEGTSAASKTPLNVTLTSVSASGGPNGVFLKWTSAAGSPGGFNVAGTTGACTFADTSGCSGGRITATAGADNTTNGIGVYLEDAASVSLTRMRIDGHPNYAVRGKTVSGFTLQTSVVDGNNGTSATADSDLGAVGEDSVRFTNLTGSALIDSSVIAGGHTNNLRVVNNTGTLNRLTVSNSTVGDPDGAGSQRGLATQAQGGQDGVHFQALDGIAAMNVTLSGNTINYGVSDVVSIINNDNAAPVGTVDAVVRNNSMVNANPQAGQVGAAGNLLVAGLGHVTYDISCNRIANSSGIALNVFKSKNVAGPGANFTGTIYNNTVGITGVPDSGGGPGANGINVDVQGDGTHTTLVKNNVILNYGQAGIGLNNVDSNGGPTTLNATVVGNTTAEPGGFAFTGFFANPGATGSDANTVTNLKLGGAGAERNDFSAGDPFDGADIFLGFPLGQYNLTQGNSASTVPTQVATDNNTPPPTTVLADDFGTVVVTTSPALPPAINESCTPPLANNNATTPALSPATSGDRQVASARPAASGFSADRAFASVMSKVRRGFALSERALPLVVGTGEARTEAPHAVALSAAPTAAFSGETVTVQVGTLPAGASVTITFQVTVNNPFPSNVQPPQVSNQGTVTADGGISVQTDDPSEPGATDPTVTPILTPPTINVNDATVTEPASGTAGMLFTVTLSHPYTQTVTVNYQTANGGANPATAGTDYTTTSGTVTFAAGQTVQTVSVPVLADGDAGEADETFLVNLSSPVNGTVGDGQATGTITDESVASPVVISELRTSGPGGAADDFVELLNTTDADITVASTDGSSGWSIVKSGTDCSATPVVVGVVPNGTVIPARGNYLLTGSAYSLGAYAAGDAALSSDIEADRNVGLFTTSNLANVSSANRYDAVGFGANTGDNCDLLREGTNLPAASGSALEHSFVRRVSKGLTEDTDDNAADFVAVSTDGSAVGSNPPRLGAPGPEGLSNPRGPVPCAAPAGAPLFGRDLIDPPVGAAAAPNVVRDLTPGVNSTLGTLAFHRTFTNNTGGSVSALRFRVTDLSTFPAAGGDADLRALSSAPVVVSTTGGNKTVLGTTLEQPPAQSLGGGLNASLAAGTVTLATPLASGASVNLRFLFGVQQAGDYDIAFVLEASPGPTGKDYWKLSGHTENGGHTDGGCNKPPVADAGPDQTAECVDGEASVTLDGSGSTDPDGDTPLTFEWTEGATTLGTTQVLNVTLPTGPHTITLTVTDPSGDSSQDTVNVNVVDTQAPVVTAPADVTVNTGPGATSCSANVTPAQLGTATADDACEGDLPTNGVRSDSQPLNAPYPVGTTVITYSATDAAGHTGFDTQNVTVVDNTPPTVTAPADITTSSDAGSCSATVNPGTATASDNCGVQSVVGTRSDNQPLNAPYPVGTTTITWTATDVNGNTATDTQTVTVQDTQAPTVSSSVAVTTMGPPFNHALINVGLSATASDNCPGLGPLQVSVYSDEDDGPAPHSPDATNIGLGTLKLRRERDGGLNGRVYLVVVKATDASGNTAASCSTVTVPKSNGAGDQAAVNAQAAAAASYCSANNGAAPSGYFVVGP